MINFDLTETISVDIDLPGWYFRIAEELAANDMHETNTFEDLITYVQRLLNSVIMFLRMSYLILA